METLIIYAHPYEGSFNNAILEKLRKKLENQGTKYKVIDLYKDKFNTLYSAEELSLFKSGKTTEPMIESYQELIRNTNELIFVFPIWWNDVPAIIKGFFDKVMKKEFAYVDTKTGVKGLLTNIECATIVTTSSSPTWYLKLFAGNAIKSVFMSATLKQIGVRKSRWINCGNINSKTEDELGNFLKQL